jgi:hypothetical protein
MPWQMRGHGLSSAEHVFFMIFSIDCYILLERATALHSMCIPPQYPKQGS